jgi:wyosine [tRNA(Phe)-imidazoG37] synthetase (radical SAM superfamily)
MYKHLFGPVPSRRLGVSLGVDLIPHKVCSLNCIYCECGPTTTLTTTRKEYVPYDAVIVEIRDFFRRYPAPDYITFSGSGEPSLNSRIGDIIEFIKENQPSVPVAVLTNGTLLSDSDTSKELLNANLIMPSLDAATQPAFLRINQPHQSLNTDTYIKGLVHFRKLFKGQIWLEVFILPGFNDDKENLDALKKAIVRICPDRIQLNTLDRPGTVSGLRPADPNLLQRIMEDWSFPQLEIIAAVAQRRQKASFRTDIENAVLETISRRPCTIEDLSMILCLHRNEINKYLDTLEAAGRIKHKVLDRGVFYQIVH